jgi:hypothetical protein
MGGGCDHGTLTTRSKNFKDSVNRAWAAAVNINIDIDYEVKKPPA